VCGMCYDFAFGSEHGVNIGEEIGERERGSE